MISEHLQEHQLYFTPYYADGFVKKLVKMHLLDFTILGDPRRKDATEYLRKHNLKIDFNGSDNNYDLVLTCSDLLIPRNIRNKKLILVQEGMTNPKNMGFYLVKWFGLPNYLGDTSTTGLSDAYDIFCVASSGYKDMFVRNGVQSNKIRVTGIPNYDNCIEYAKNDFPHKNYVLVATSDTRETYNYENRKKFIKKAVKIANGRQIIFKLHPNEKVGRATREVNKWAPGALVYSKGNVHEMIANADVLITKFSTVVYTGIALGKEVYSGFDLKMLKKLSPTQNGGRSAANIAGVCNDLLNSKPAKKIRKKEMLKMISLFQIKKNKKKTTVEI